MAIFALSFLTLIFSTLSVGSRIEGVDQIRIVLLVHVFSCIAGGVLGVVLPFVMKQRNVGVVLMGFLFASMPLFMQLGRIFFAMLSDIFGRKVFFMLNGVLGAVSGLIYYLAHTPSGFLFGKVVEGTKDGALWAVNRAFLLERNGCLNPLVCFGRC